MPIYSDKVLDLSKNRRKMAEFKEIFNRAIEIRKQYAELEKIVMGKPWGYYEKTQGMMVDMGEFMELIMAKANVRRNKWGDELDKNLAHELSDIMWSVLVIANELNIDLEHEFLESMDALEERIPGEIEIVKGKV